MIISLVEGLKIVEVNKAILPSLISDNLCLISWSIIPHSVSELFFKGPFNLAESYRDKTDACTRALEDVPLFSILIGLPSLVFTKILA